MKDVKLYFKRLFCFHDFVYIRGYKKRNGTRVKIYKCINCDKRKYKEVG